MPIAGATPCRARIASSRFAASRPLSTPLYQAIRTRVRSDTKYDAPMPTNAEPLAEQFDVRTPGRGLLEITDRVRAVVQQWGGSTGLCTVFIRHTSASLTIQENADPSAQHDLEAFLERIAPEREPWYTHTSEGADDMPSHLRAALTDVSLSIPIIDGALALGTWQGVYLWEHRARPHTRKIVVHVG